MEYHFNYIITIHNKEELIEEVLLSVLMCCRKNSRIIAVLDGCTDRTESIIDGIIKKYRSLPIKKVFTNDVHELLSINAGLSAANHDGDGFNIILQDDVILGDFLFQEKIENLYNNVNFNLGYLSLRLGANLDENIFKFNSHIPLVDYIESVFGHGLPEATPLLPEFFAVVDIPIKSPVCIPFHVIRKVGLLEEKLAPYAHDDTDFAIRCLEAGYQNGVFALKFHSDIKWGGTRVNPHPQIAAIQLRNIKLIKKLHRSAISKIISVSKDHKPNGSFSSVSEKESSDALNKFLHNRDFMTHSTSNKGLISRILGKCRRILKP